MLPGISDDPLISKEHEVFDRITDEVCQNYLKDLKFNNKVVLVQKILCDANEDIKFGVKNFIEEFLKCGVKAAKEDGRYKSLHADFKDLLLHVERRKYEITFLKCDKCVRCLEYTSNSPNVKEFMKAHKNKHFESRPCLERKGHFMTFLEQEHCDVEITPNAELPSKLETDLGSCDICPSWAFNSKMEHDRHYSFFHEKKTHYCQRSANVANSIS